jgi:hypothetical protein
MFLRGAAQVAPNPNPNPTPTNMKVNISKYNAADRLVDLGFSPPAALAIVEHLEQLEESLDCDIDFDAVAIYHHWDEYPSAADARAAGHRDVDELAIEFDGGVLVPTPTPTK